MDNNNHDSSISQQQQQQSIRPVHNPNAQMQEVPSSSSEKPSPVAHQNNNNHSNNSQSYSSQSVFETLLKNPYTGTARDAVALLSQRAPLIAAKTVPEECFLFLKATALHAHHLMEVLNGAGAVGSSTSSSSSNGNNLVAGMNQNGLSQVQALDSEQRLVSDVIQASGCAVTQCRHRSEISQSGIIPVLAQLAISCQPSKSPTQSLSSTFPSIKPSAQQSFPDDDTDTNNHSSSSSNIPNAHVLTAAHTELLQACISAGNYTYACQFNDQYPVLSVQPYKVNSSITAEQYLRYFYLLGMARLGLRRHQDAKSAFELGFTMPGNIISAIMIACRKKHILVRCLLLEDEWEDTFEGAMMENSFALDQNRFALEEEYDNRNIRSVLAMKSPTIHSDENLNSTNLSSAKATPTESKQKLLKEMIHTLPKCTSLAIAQYLNNSSTSSPGSEYPPMNTGGEGTSGEDVMAQEVFNQGRASYSTTNADIQILSSGSQQETHLYFYYKLANAFIDDNWQAFDKIKKLMEQVLKLDGNWGLVNQVQERMGIPRKLSNIAKLYEVIPLSKLADKLGLSSPDEAEEVVRKTIMEQDAINHNDSTDLCIKPNFQAQIDQEEEVVYFPLRDSSPLDGLELEQQQVGLTTRIQKCIELMERMQHLDITLSTSPKFIAECNNPSNYAGRSEARSGSNSGSGGRHSLWAKRFGDFDA